MLHAAPVRLFSSVPHTHLKNSDLFPRIPGKNKSLAREYQLVKSVSSLTPHHMYARKPICPTYGGMNARSRSSHESHLSRLLRTVQNIAHDTERRDVPYGIYLSRFLKRTVNVHFEQRLSSRVRENFKNILIGCWSLVMHFGNKY